MQKAYNAKQAVIKSDGNTIWCKNVHKIQGKNLRTTFISAKNNIIEQRNLAMEEILGLAGQAIPDTYLISKSNTMVMAYATSSWQPIPGKAILECINTQWELFTVDGFDDFVQSELVYKKFSKD